MLDASVPEATVDEDGQLTAGEGNVDGSTPLPGNRVVKAVP
jgi:hypothetical protein